MKTRQWIVLLALGTLTSQVAMAEGGSVYSFGGGSCTSQGLWTQTALSTTQNLRQIIIKLKDNPKCHGPSTAILNHIQSLEENVSSTRSTPEKESRLSQIPGEIGALRSYVMSNPEDKESIFKLLMNRTVEETTLRTQVDENHQNIARGLSDLGSRVERGTKAGLGVLNSVIDTIPDLDECLDGDGAQVIGSVFSASVKVASSFASSGENNIGTELAKTISKLTGLARARKYSMALRDLNKEEFKASMACLIEVTSGAYCQVRDQMTLFQSAMKELKNDSNNFGEMVEDNPFAGFYVLNTHVPNITRWLQKIQIGVDPKLPTDATFQNKIQQDVTDFYKNIKVIQGAYNSKLVSIKNYKTDAEKKNAVIQMVITIANEMVGGAFSRDTDVNFFTLSTQQVKIPFILLGMPNVPGQVIGVNGTYPMPYGEWLNANMDNIREIDNPLEAAERIGANMDKIIKASSLSAIEYYNQWYIVDKSALVDESLININYSVVDSLKAVDGFLSVATKRINKLNGNKSLLVNIKDTKERIAKILAGYEDLNKVGESITKNMNKRLTEEDILKHANVHEKLVNVIYDQFNIMLSRSGFLANRMINFVNNDYALLINNKVGFDEKQKDLFVSQGMAALESMLQSYNGNPANIKTDLNMALSINSGNLDALERILKNSLSATMSELEEEITGEKVGLLTAYNRSQQDYHKDMAKKNIFLRYLSIQNPFSYMAYVYKNLDRYPRSESGMAIRGESEFEEASHLKAQLCIQALAFKDQTPFSRYCDDTVLISVLDEDKLSSSYNEILTRHLNDNKLEKKRRNSLNNSDRVCAFRDYNRKTMVRFMQQNKAK